MQMSKAWEDYLDRLVAHVTYVLEDKLVSVVLAGSIAMGDGQNTSDLDVIVLTERTVGEAEKQELATCLSHSGFPCPAHGLDLIVYRVDQVSSEHRNPIYEMSLATGGFWEDEIDLGGEYPGGVIDMEIARAHGRSLFGDLSAFGSIPKEWIWEELLLTVAWHRKNLHDPFHDPFGSNAVLNACRAWHFFEKGNLVSKSAGAEWAKKRSDHTDLISLALAVRDKGLSERLDREAVMRLLDEVEAKITRSG